MANNDFTRDTQQGTSIPTSTKHNIEESNIQTQNDGKSTYNYILHNYYITFLKTYTFYLKKGKRIKVDDVD